MSAALGLRSARPLTVRPLLHGLALAFTCSCVTAQAWGQFRPKETINPIYKLLKNERDKQLVAELEKSFTKESLRYFEMVIAPCEEGQELTATGLIGIAWNTTNPQLKERVVHAQKVVRAGGVQMGVTVSLGIRNGRLSLLGGTLHSADAARLAQFLSSDEAKAMKIHDPGAAGAAHVYREAVIEASRRKAPSGGDTFAFRFEENRNQVRYVVRFCRRLSWFEQCGAGELKKQAQLLHERLQALNEVAEAARKDPAAAAARYPKLRSLPKEVNLKDIRDVDLETVEAALETAPGGGLVVAPWDLSPAQRAVFNAMPPTPPGDVVTAPPPDPNKPALPPKTKSKTKGTPKGR